MKAQHVHQQWTLAGGRDSTWQGASPCLQPGAPEGEEGRLERRPRPLLRHPCATRMQELCHCAIAQQSFGTGLRASQGAKSWRNLRPRGGRGGRLGGCADSTGNSARRHALSRRGDTGDRRENGATAPAEVTFSGRKSVGLPYHSAHKVSGRSSGTSSGRKQ